MAIFFHKLSENNSSHFLETLCSRSQQSIALNDFLKKVQFSSETCILQIYGVLLQTEYASQNPIECIHYNLLTDITISTLIFIENYTKKTVNWMFKSTQQKNGSTVTTYPCLCHVHLVCGAIVLLYVSLKRWIDDPKLISK